jgi:hypothetical protein
VNPGTLKRCKQLTVRLSGAMLDRPLRPEAEELS